MGEKTDFGRDFLHLARELQLLGSDTGNLDPVADAAARLFLVHSWGLSVKEGDEANELFWEQLNAGELGELSKAVRRITARISDDRAAKERLIVQLAAIAAMDFDITDKEGAFLRWFQEAFDVRPSEYKAMIQQGLDLAVALDYFGTVYLEKKKAE